MDDNSKKPTKGFEWYECKKQFSYKKLEEDKSSVAKSSDTNKKEENKNQTSKRHSN